MCWKFISKFCPKIIEKVVIDEEIIVENVDKKNLYIFVMKMKKKLRIKFQNKFINIINAYNYIIIMNNFVLDKILIGKYIHFINCKIRTLSFVNLIKSKSIKNCKIKNLILDKNIQITNNLSKTPFWNLSLENSKINKIIYKN